MDEVFQLKSTQLAYEFNITIVNDDILETIEEFLVSVTHVTEDGSIDIDPNVAIVTVADDDGK